MRDKVWRIRVYIYKVKKLKKRNDVNLNDINFLERMWKKSCKKLNNLELDIILIFLKVFFYNLIKKKYEEYLVVVISNYFFWEKKYIIKLLIVFR